MSSKFRQFKTHDTGFTFIELMIAMAIGAFLSLVVLTTFAQVNRNQIQDEQIAMISENGRYALRALGRSLMLGGFFGGISDVSGILVDDSAASSSNCEVGGFVANNPSVNIVNDASAAQAATYDCLDTADFLESTDILAVMRVSDAPIKMPSSGGVHVATNSFSGVIYSGAVPATMSPPVEIWRFLPEIYYIINEQNLAGEDVPALCRYSLDKDTALMERRCLADGIENLQIEFGIDSNSDFVADYYENAPSSADMANAVSARIYILVRGNIELSGYVNDKSFLLGAKLVPATNDGFLRKVFSTTVELKNAGGSAILPIDSGAS